MCRVILQATLQAMPNHRRQQRKVGNEPKPKAQKKRGRDETVKAVAGGQPRPVVNPILAGILHRSKQDPTTESKPSPHTGNFHGPPNESQKEIARGAVGKGIRHSFSFNGMKPAPLPPRPGANENGSDSVVQAGLSALKNNFESSFNSGTREGQASTQPAPNSMSYVPGSLRRDDSLVDLAMIPLVEDAPVSEPEFLSSSAGLNFIDFPWQDPNASAG